MKLIWDGKAPEYNYEYKDNKIKFEFLESRKGIVGDITEKVDKMKEEYLRIAPMTIEEFFNGPLFLSEHKINCMDYDGDGNDEIFNIYNITNEQLAWRLACLYTVWEIRDGRVQARNGIIPVNNSVESGILQHIMENAYVDIDELEKFVKENHPDEAGRFSIDSMLENDFYRLQNSRITLNFD